MRRESTTWLFATFALIALVPVLLLGVILATSYQSDANLRGLAQGRREAHLIAETAVQPLLDGRPLAQGLSRTELAGLQRLATETADHGDVQRLRLRDLAGHVVFSHDGSGFDEKPDAEALEAARGTEVARLTQLDADSTRDRNAGGQSVEIYLPLTAGTPRVRVGVLEVYLPYAPIGADVSAGVHSLYRNLAIGLTALYLVLFGIAFWVGRRLRRQVRLNAYLAEHDSLTDLPNRDLFRQRAMAALDIGRETARPTTIAIIDLDRFKVVNDTLGHQNGDRLLTALSHRLASHLRGVDFLARLGGDEFGIVLRNIADPEEVLLRLRAVIQREIEINGLPLSVEASIGYVTAPEDGAEVGELLQLAEVAMYAAKTHHAGVVRYHASQNQYDASNLALMAELRHAIASDQLLLHYQPKVNIGDHRVETVEALVRWEHPAQGLLYPDRFIPLAEQTDLIDKLTAWVVKEALGDLARFGEGSDHLTVAVNVSARNLGRAGFAHQVVKALEEANVDARRLIIEVTETALMTDPVRAASVLDEISATGVQISIDDFGSGQTSLGYLSTLPIHEIKIDRSFIADMLENPGHAAIVRSIVELGHNLSFRVVGEGVETHDVLAGLASTACDLAQGYLFARLMPAGDLGDWLNRAEHPDTAAAPS